MKRKWLYLGIALGLVLAVACLGVYRYLRARTIMVPQFYDGMVHEPILHTGPGTPGKPSFISATSESWYDEQDGHVRLEVTLSSEVDAAGHAVRKSPPEFSVTLIRVGRDAAWKPSQFFHLLADGKPVKVSYSDGSAEDPYYFERSVKIGIEESLYGDVTAAGLKQLGEARRAQVRVGKETNDLSPQTQAMLLKLLAD
ncbi:hypothetical protein ACN469_21635 [Corallococcus terminator]